MYLIPKSKMSQKTLQGINLKLNISQVWKVMRTTGCKPGEYALFKKDDEGTFNSFKGYISYNNICDWFEMIKGTERA